MSVDTSVVPDTLSEVEEEIEEADESDKLDTSFDDFMFAFTHSDRLQSKRIVWPLSYTDVDGDTKKINSFNCASEFRFLKEDFYTVLYGDRKQVENQKSDMEDSLVVVERIEFRGHHRVVVGAVAEVHLLLTRAHESQLVIDVQP